MRKWALVLLLILAVGAAGAASANHDPTCRAPEQAGPNCPGDNGIDGCDGVNTAEEHVEGTPGAQALVLVASILEEEGGDHDCDPQEQHPARGPGR